MENVRIGAVNWDCSLPSETFFGYYQTRTLSPRKYRYATPFYADIINENKISYHLRNQEEYDRELSYAIDAGIDYFAYVYYPDEGSREYISLTYEDCSHRVYELNYARKMHESSKLRNKIGIAAIVIPLHKYADSDLLSLTKLFCEDYYEKIDGRPLVYLFQDIPSSLTARINSLCEEKNIPLPFYCAMISNCKDKFDYSVVDSLSDYACGKSGITEFYELCEAMQEHNARRLEKCKEKNLSLIPHFSFGWDPSPRIDIPSPWVTYPDVSYHRSASCEEIYKGAQKLACWIEENLKGGFIGHIMTFAWNEFEEGGWICPTYNDDLSVNTDRIAVMKKISTLWKEKLR